jgi:hypothetical protein
VSTSGDPSGGRYYFLDQTVSNDVTYWYYVEDVDVNGQATLHGPVSAKPEAGLGAADQGVLTGGAYVGGQVNDGSGPSGDGVDPDGSTSSEALPLAGGARITSVDGTGFWIEIDVPRFARGTITGDDGLVYDHVTIAGYSDAIDLDRPVVPTRNVLVELGDVGSATLQDLSTESETSGGYSLPFQLAGSPLPVLGARPSGFDGATAWPAQPLEVLGVAQVSDRHLLTLRVNPIAFLADSGETVYHRRITARIVLGPSTAAPTANAALATQASLATSAGVLEITVAEDGVVRLTGADLQAAGFDVAGDPRDLWLYTLGQPVSIRLDGEADGSLDPGDVLEFFGQRNQTRATGSTQTRYADQNAYWLAYGTGPGPRIADVDGSPAEASLAPFTSYREGVLYEQQRRLNSGPQAEGSDHWFTDLLTNRSQTYTLSLSGVAQPALATLRYRLRGRSALPADPDHHVQIEVGGALVADLLFDGQVEVTGEAPLPAVTSGDATVLVRVMGGSQDSVYVDWLELSYQRRFQAFGAAGAGDGLRFAAPASGKHRVENLATDDVEVWDVSDPRAPRRLTGGLIERTNVVASPDGSLAAGTSYQVTFDTTVGGLHPATARELVVLTGAAKKGATLQLHTPTQGLQTGAHGADYLVITDRTLASAASRLAAYRQGRGLRAEVVYVDEIMDEFAFGNTDPEAIRDFLRHAHQTWALPRVKYVCLLGDGHHDFKDNLGFGTANLVPPLMIETEFSWAPSDNRLASVVGGDVLPDLKIGRLPARDLAEAQRMLDRIEQYEGAPFDATWHENHLFVADDEDIYDFEAMCEGLIGRLPAGHQVVRAYHTPAADPALITDAIVATQNGTGALLTVYSGHGNSRFWGNESFFSTYRSTPVRGENDLDKLTNAGRPTVGLVFNCLSGLYSNPTGVFDTMAEAWVREPDGGAVAFWASSSLTRPHPQDLLAQHVFDLLFSEGVGVLGDAADAAKLRLAADGEYPNVIESWVLLGDPATSLQGEVIALAQPNPMPPPPPPTPVVVGSSEEPAAVSVHNRSSGCNLLGAAGETDSLFLSLLILVLAGLRRRAGLSPEPLGVQRRALA